MSDIGKTARQYFKTERVVSLKIISHGASFISDHSIVPSSSISFDDYSSVFLIQEYLQYLVSSMCSTREVVQYS